MTAGQSSLGHRSEQALAETLRRRRVAAMYSDARLVRAYPTGNERMREAQRLIREAMYEQTLGRLTVAERDRMVATLSFAAEAMRVPREDRSDEPPVAGQELGEGETLC